MTWTNENMHRLCSVSIPLLTLSPSSPVSLAWRASMSPAIVFPFFHGTVVYLLQTLTSHNIRTILFYRYKIASLHSSHVPCALAQLTAVQMAVIDLHILNYFKQSAAKHQAEERARFLTAAGEPQVSCRVALFVFSLFFSSTNVRCRSYTLSVYVCRSDLPPWTELRCNDHLLLLGLPNSLWL